MLHYENWQLYLRTGLKLKQLHCIMEFNQLQWFKPYAKLNTQKKAEKKMEVKVEKHCTNP